MKIAIIGGGISGLSAAYLTLKEAKNKNIAIELYIFEKENKLGGTISTISKNGFICEGGPNGFLNSRKETMDLIKDLDLEKKLLVSNKESKKRYVYDGNRMWKIPEKPIEFLSSGYISFKGKLRILSEFFRPAKDIENESVADFVRRRLGFEAAEKLIDPMVRGIYAGDIEKLELKSAFSRIKELEKNYGSLFKAMFKLKRGGAPTGHLASFDLGLYRLIEALEEQIQGRIIKGEEVLHIERKDKSWQVKTKSEELFFDKVILSVPAYKLKDIYKPVSELCDKIIYQPLNVVHLGYKLKKMPIKPDGFGFISLKAAKTNLLGAIYASNMFKNRAPEGHILISAMIGGAFKNEVRHISDEEIISLSINDINRILNIVDRPDFVQHWRHNNAIPNYNMGYSKIKEEIIKIIDKEEGLYLCGNAFFGVGINDTIKRAKELSNIVLDL
jgi:oxygen-dependent protoporphyrinogen oxidase